MRGDSITRSSRRRLPKFSSLAPYLIRHKKFYNGRSGMVVLDLLRWHSSRLQHTGVLPPKPFPLLSPAFHCLRSLTSLALSRPHPCSATSLPAISPLFAQAVPQARTAFSHDIQRHFANFTLRVLSRAYNTLYAPPCTTTHSMPISKILRHLYTTAYASPAVLDEMQELGFGPDLRADSSRYRTEIFPSLHASGLAFLPCRICPFL